MVSSAQIKLNNLLPEWSIKLDLSNSVFTLSLLLLLLLCFILLNADCTVTEDIDLLKSIYLTHTLVTKHQAYCVSLFYSNAAQLYLLANLSELFHFILENVRHGLWLQKLAVAWKKEWNELKTLPGQGMFVLKLLHDKIIESAQTQNAQEGKWHGHCF